LQNLPIVKGKAITEYSVDGKVENENEFTGMSTSFILKLSVLWYKVVFLAKIGRNTPGKIPKCDNMSI